MIPQDIAWELYQRRTAFVLGFHGCDREVGEAVLDGREQHLLPSSNDYDWLGTGIYFWEFNPLRALEFAHQSSQGAKHSRGAISTPFVLGAVIDLGICLDLRDSAALAEVKTAYEYLQAITTELPTNGPGLKLRRLDCAVFNLVHELRSSGSLRSYDSTRGSYREGLALYPGTDISHQDHTQICIRNPDCILGYFRPIQRNRA